MICDDLHICCSKKRIFSIAALNYQTVLCKSAEMDMNKYKPLSPMSMRPHPPNENACNPLYSGAQYEQIHDYF